MIGTAKVKTLAVCVSFSLTTTTIEVKSDDAVADSMTQLYPTMELTFISALNKNPFM